IPNTVPVPGSAISCQDVPSQCIAEVDVDPGTAHMSLGPRPSIWRTASDEGFGTCDHPVPSYCSMLVPPEVLPTAQTSLFRKATTSLRKPAGEAAFDLRHSVPFHRSISWYSLKPFSYIPTAQAFPDARTQTC